jgi:hypothetical protein
MNSHIQPWHIMSYEALTSGSSQSFGLIPCFVGTTPSVAIAMFQEHSGSVHVMPLFVALTDDMNVTYPDRSSGGTGGGPDRASLRQDFHTNKSITSPSPTS